MKRRNIKLRDEVISMAEDGAPAQVIADEMQISKAYVYLILQEAGVKAKPTRVSPIHGLAREAVNRLVESYTGGSVMTKLLEEYELTYHQLYDLLRREGVPIRDIISDKKASKKEAYNVAVDLYKQRIPLWQIREETGIAGQELYRELHRRQMASSRKRINKAGFSIPEGVYDPNPVPPDMDLGMEIDPFEDLLPEDEDEDPPERDGTSDNANVRVHWGE